MKTYNYTHWMYWDLINKASADTCVRTLNKMGYLAEVELNHDETEWLVLAATGPISLDALESTTLVVREVVESLGGLYDFGEFALVGKPSEEEMSSIVAALTALHKGN